MVQWPDKSFVAIALDNTVWLCPSVSYWFGCSQLPNSGRLKSIDLMSDKNTLIGVGLDNQLYTRSGLLGNWALVPNSGSVVDITVLSNGVLLGTGLDKQLYSKQTIDDPWVFQGSCCVSRTAGLRDGSILGIGDGNTIYKMANLGAPWTYVPNSAAVISVTPVADMVQVPVLLGMSRDGTIHGKRAASLSEPWTQIPSGIKAIDIIETSYVYFVILGTDYNMYGCNSLLTSATCSQVKNSGGVKSISYIDGGKTLIGVGFDNQLYTRSGNVQEASYWSLVPNSGRVVDVTVLGSNVIVGTAPDGNLYTKKDLNSPWVFSPGGCCVTRTTGNGYYGLYGIGTDGAVYVKDNLESNWVLVPNSEYVISVAGSLLY
ncbi:hypothetical protein BCR33DRAFT_714722 [Rhizoclosmatium globosum]|uniref:Uncharacterized protein n=1 Tax=Rhizoclosmatium globosum TaxID=329046 RepID=A0A1Y2CML8_9FUNG|nr:hypothetical protein BCR33DRAFT_714722 [Rhizoclosmatium globosum]|eukprot:ORY47615.1 hypothetical protein BCR33DRAFT_714722 [Rhizoclosmatium globosum]